MKANELMIGDWVKLESYNCKFIQLTTIDETYNSISYFDADAEGELTLQLTAIEPIPLTPEILEKNGFVYNEIPFVQGWEQYGLTLTVGGDGFRVSCGQNVSIIIDSVHQLQHALRLCGIEKEIVL